MLKKMSQIHLQFIKHSSMCGNFLTLSFNRVIVTFFLLISIGANAADIRGKVLDANTGEPLVGATVNIAGTKSKSFVKLDGSFQIKNLEAGDYAISISYTGYTTIEKNIKINNKSEVKTIDFLVESISSALSSVTVTTSNQNGTTGRRLEKIADPIINVLSSKTIQLLPDITVANALQRMSGVTIEKSSSGQARYPIIRGMEKRYINTLVNGIKIPSPDNKSRFIPLDLFPSELLERLEVSKSLTPSMEGDAIGGSINLVMKDAPDKFLIQANASTGYNTSFIDQKYSKFDKSTIEKESPNEKNNVSLVPNYTYTAVPTDFNKSHLNYTNLVRPINSTIGLTIGDRLGAEKKLGYLFSGTYQNIYTGSQSTFFLPNAQPGLGNIPQFVELQNRQYSTQSTRIGLNSKFDYKIDENNKIAWINTYARLEDKQTRIISDTIALNSLVNVFNRSSWQYQSIFNSTVQGFHQIGEEAKVDWSVGYSKANNHLPDMIEFQHEYPVTTGKPDVLGGLSHKWSYNSDKDYSAYVNLTQNFVPSLGKKLEFKLGGMIRNKSRNNFYNAYSMKPQLPLGNSNQLFTNINNAIFIFNPISAGIPTENGNSYSFNETITALYLQEKWTISDKLELLGGYRFEQTNQHYDTKLGEEVDAKSGDINYLDILPSAQLKYALNATQNFRLAYYKALARPAFAELIPDGPDGEYFKEIGNPQGLNHTTADNFDIRYELYPGSADQFLIGGFYKNINNPIEYAAVKTGVTAQSLIPRNFGTATNYGVELVAIKYLGVLGVSANYTYTKSEITTDKLYYFRNTSGQITSIIDKETRPLQGQANHIGNVSLLYKNPKNGLDVQIAFVYTGARISLVSPYKGLDYWQAPTTQLDFSFEKRFNKKFSFYGKVNNITNTPLQLEIHQSYDAYLAASGSRKLALQTDPANKIIVQQDYFKTSFLFGVRFKF